MTRAAHCFKLSSDQGLAVLQLLYALCLRDGHGVPIDLKSAAHYFKHSGDQGNASGQRN
jgi:TPR repeat protein